MHSRALKTQNPQVRNGGAGEKSGRKNQAYQRTNPGRSRGNVGLARVVRQVHDRHRAPDAWRRVPGRRCGEYGFLPAGGFKFNFGIAVHSIAALRPIQINDHAVGELAAGFEPPRAPQGKDPERTEQCAHESEERASNDSCLHATFTLLTVSVIGPTISVRGARVND